MKLSKKVWIPLVVLGALVCAFVIVFPILWCCVYKVQAKVSAAQVDDKNQVYVAWDTDKLVDSVEISVYHGKDLVSRETLANSTQLLAGHKKVDAIYGKCRVVVKAHRGMFTATEEKNVNITAGEYNFAPLTATMPVTIFTLSLESVTNQGQIPTFVWFKRSGAWDYTALPENVYTVPTVSQKQILNSKETEIYNETAKYIKELYELDKTSRFNLYYNDYFAWGWLQATVAQGIPAANYNVTLISDGTASFADFNKNFNNANHDTNVARYNEMKTKYNTLKKQVAKKGFYDGTSTSFAIKGNDLKEYAFVMAKEETNVDWWLSRISGTMATNDATIYSELQACCAVKDLNTLVQAISPKVAYMKWLQTGDNISKTDEEKAQKLQELTEERENLWFGEEALLDLYGFADDMFEAATKSGKQAMVILGTWSSGDVGNEEPYLKEYTKALMAHYGFENYVYYYKGHPRFPTNSIPGKLEMVQSIGLTDVDSTIPAELLFFFNENAVASGYQSTTYVSLGQENSKALYGRGKESALAGLSYAANLEMFITKAGTTVGNLNVGENAFLLEFNDTTNYDIAIYDSVKNTIKYYKLNGSSEYEQVA